MDDLECSDNLSRKILETLEEATGDAIAYGKSALIKVPLDYDVCFSTFRHNIERARDGDSLNVLCILTDEAELYLLVECATMPFKLEEQDVLDGITIERWCNFAGDGYNTEIGGLG